MGGFALKLETKEQVTLTLPSELVRQIAERANAMHVSVDATVAVLLTNGLKVQHEKEQEIEGLYNNLLNSPDVQDRVAICDELGQSVFGK